MSYFQHVVGHHIIHKAGEGAEKAPITTAGGLCVGIIAGVAVVATGGAALGPILGGAAAGGAMGSVGGGLLGNLTKI